MNSKSGQRLSMEELKRLNQPQMPPAPLDSPTRQEWDDLPAAVSALYQLEGMNSGRLERLEASVGAQEALLRQISAQVGNCPTQEQIAALARDVAQMRENLQQAGRKRERSFSLPRPRLPYIPWTRVLLALAALLLTGLVLWVVWSSSAEIWNSLSPIFQ